jgi:hypothetical protein
MSIMQKYGYLIVAAASAILAAPAHAGLSLNSLAANSLAANVISLNTLPANVVSPSTTPAINSAGEIGRVVAVELPRR